MRKNKKVLAGLAAALMLSLAGCSAKATEPTEAIAQSSEAAGGQASVPGSPESDADTPESGTDIFVDDLGREVELTLPITRACVANRYNNELIRAVGAGGSVVGVDIYTSQDEVYWP